MINIFKVLRSLCLIIIVIFSSFNKCSASNFKDTLDLRDKLSLAGFELLDSVAQNYSVFISGENHAYRSSNSKLWLKTIQYLHQHAGLTTIMIEYGQASGWLINQYINSGDTALFTVLDNYARKEYSDVYKALMEYNMELPEKDRLQLVGIDLERGVNSALKVMSMLVPEGRRGHDSIDIHVESLLGLVEYQDRELFNSRDDEKEDDDLFTYYKFSFQRTINLIIENFNRHPNHYRDLLDSNFTQFERTIRNLEDVRRWTALENDETVQNYVYREKYMYKRFVEEYNSRGGKFFGQFGRCHSTKKLAEKNACEWYMFRSFASRLKQDTSLNLTNKILTMGILYESDDYSKYDWSPIEDHVDGLFSKMDDDRVLMYDLQSDTTLYNFFKDDFDYLFLNTTSPSEEFEFVLNDVLGDLDNSVSARIVYAYGLTKFDLQSINDMLTNLNVDGFNQTLKSHNIEITSLDMDNPYLVSRSSFGWYRGQTVQPLKNSTRKINQTLKGFTYTSSSLFNLLPKVKFVDILAGVSLGYTQLTLEFEQLYDQPVNNPSAAIFGNQGFTTYTNPGITGGYLAGVNINLGLITFGATYGYQHDWSKTKWRAKKRLHDGPKTRLDGNYLMFRAGFNFQKP